MFQQQIFIYHQQKLITLVKLSVSPQQNGVLACYYVSPRWGWVNYIRNLPICIKHK